MKKVRIDLTTTETQRLYLYDSVEALYDGLYSNISPEDDEYCYSIVLNTGEYIEAEWLGCEIDLEPDGSYKKYDYIRLAKALTPKNASGVVVSVYVGWSLSGNIPFLSSDQGNLRFTKINEFESTLDVEKILETSEEEKSDSIEHNGPLN